MGRKWRKKIKEIKEKHRWGFYMSGGWEGEEEDISVLSHVRFIWKRKKIGGEILGTGAKHLLDIYMFKLISKSFTVDPSSLHMHSRVET